MYDHKKRHSENDTITKLSVVVPIYNNLETLEKLAFQLRTNLTDISESYEIIFVDDRGPQLVWPIIKKMSDADRRIKGVRLSRNYGQHSAISAGLSVAKAEWYIVMDGDLQDSPSAIPRLYRHAIEHNLDAVIARRKGEEISKSKKLGSVIFNKTLQVLAGLPSSSDKGNFRIFSHKMAEAYRMYPEKMRVFPAIMSHVGFEVGELEIKRPDREAGESSYTFKKLFALAFDTIISNSIKPMYFIASLGVIVSLIAFISALILILRKLIHGIDVEGWASLMTAMMLIGGIQIFAISFVGIYVGKVFFEVKKRPNFIISQKTF